MKTVSKLEDIMFILLELVLLGIRTFERDSLDTIQGYTICTNYSCDTSPVGGIGGGVPKSFSG